MILKARLSLALLGRWRRVPLWVSLLLRAVA
jgi:hypothetical protein